jgi:A/G-specific adenine glycosylase
MSSDFSNLIITWYHKNQRDLPWRNTTDPYKIWLSEIILQQTRVAQGLPYYMKFVENYATVADLANAPEDEVMRLWQGLGYYSRARNLHECAKSVVNDYNSKFPQSYKELLKLKGVGKYTAAAIASFAFGETVPVVDGNVYRVLARNFLINDDIAQPKSFSKFFKLAQELIPDHDSESFNQAIMELGAIVCKPKKPDCDICPLSISCQARMQHKQLELPVKKKNLKVKNRFLYYLIWEKDEKLAMKKRGANDIWQGLFDFEVIESEAAMETEEILNSIYQRYGETEIVNISEPVKHILTHQRIAAVFIQLKASNQNNLMENDLVYYSKAEIEDLPKPRLIQNYLTREII